VQATDTWMTADVGLSWRIEPTAAWWKIRGQGQLLFFFWRFTKSQSAEYGQIFGNPISDF